MENGGGGEGGGGGEEEESKEEENKRDKTMAQREQIDEEAEEKEETKQQKSDQTRKSERQLKRLRASMPRASLTHKMPTTRRSQSRGMLIPSLAPHCHLWCTSPSPARAPDANYRAQAIQIKGTCQPMRIRAPSNLRRGRRSKSST